jgi:hypothetical protein
VAPRRKYWMNSLHTPTSMYSSKSSSYSPSLTSYTGKPSYSAERFTKKKKDWMSRSLMIFTLNIS